MQISKERCLIVDLKTHENVSKQFFFLLIYYIFKRFSRMKKSFIVLFIIICKYRPLQIAIKVETSSTNEFYQNCPMSK